jgi:hypothetical protein
MKVFRFEAAARQRPLRRLPIWLMVSVVALVGCATTTYGPDEIEAALEQLRPSPTDVSFGEYLTSCALEAGYSGELAIDEQGSVESESLTSRDEEILRECTTASEEVFVFPAIEDDRLQLVALYELQIRAAGCVRDRLGMEPQLPSLERYVDSGGDWNVYDDAVPADQAQWAQWNDACPQDLWHYYQGRS